MSNDNESKNNGVKPSPSTPSSINQKENRHRFQLWVSLPMASFIACRKYLFENGLSIQELFSRVLIMLENKDPAIKPIVEAAKKNKVANASTPYVFTNPRSIYAVLEHFNPLKNKEE